MGCAASTCAVSNKAIYLIKVDVFGPDDLECAIPVQQLMLKPGQSGAIRMRKGANLRVSGERLRSQNRCMYKPCMSPVSFDFLAASLFRRKPEYIAIVA